MMQSGRAQSHHGLYLRNFVTPTITDTMLLLPFATMRGKGSSDPLSFPKLQPCDVEALT